MATRASSELKAVRASIEAAQTHYDVLAVPAGAQADAIKQAHRRLARLLHPDRCRLDDAHALMARVNGAYACLSDKDARRRYDAVNKTAEGVCEACKGEGKRYKQQGFYKRLMATCLACNGTGAAP